MLGIMQEHPLMISSLIEHAARFHPDSEIVTRTVEGPIHRTNYLELRNRSKQVANALEKLGIEQGDRVGTLAWNTYRHMELYFGVSGSGAVLHTINPRLFEEQIEYIINHAEDRVLMFDIAFTDLVQKLAPKLKSVEFYIAMTDKDSMPDMDLPNLYCYEELVQAEKPDYQWPLFDERTASSLCYTSGTTGNPKGVLYSHRSTVLHTIMAATPDGANISASECLLLIVPMFHANAWGIPYAAAMTGAKVVLPGPRLDGENLYDLMATEGVTFSQGVPTVWLMFLQYIDSKPGLDLSKLPLRKVSIGGAAPPRSMIERFEDNGIDVMQGWGMTETSPLGFVNGDLLPKHKNLSKDERFAIKSKQGRGIWGVESKITDDEGNEQPWDGESVGNLMIRGPWIAAGYFKKDNSDQLDADGYFPTGDIATIDSNGYLQLVDRSKDVIKSGGEWISTMELENQAVSHPDVAEAAVIGIHHPTWQERPLLIVVAKEGATVTSDDLMQFLGERVAKWWLPDDIAFVDELPHTATGKLLKTKLREQFKGYVAAESS
ncbi:fatty-acyl-CoA synthase [Marinobacter segnicrescens]|uniref:Fatty-acyl-CoA synthase n=1 Tax=Marinobacter segnicrescens TaxID=430453 RepID=A0A1H9Z6Y3_9GAMM|nr:3-(methylthio)propionyl-CoA ligase [Marinobacter segnicrescens]SES77314.1 fatty-acyl-CoA synthase [Marinobacter segnicrescens]